MRLFRARQHQPKPVDGPLAEHEEQLRQLRRELADHRGRERRVIACLDDALAEQRRLYPDDRDEQLMNLCLDARAILAPPSVGSQVLRGAAPYAPGGAVR